MFMPVGAMRMPERFVAMPYPLRTITSLFIAAALFSLASAGGADAIAQERSAQERIIRDIETRGFGGVTGLMRRGENYVFQAVDPFGDKVRVVMNVATGEIVGLSRVIPKKK
jgi:hypothetical protein